MGVPLAFDCLSNTWYENSCASTVSTVKTSRKKTKMTVVLTCCANGSKLKTMIILKMYIYLK